MGSAPEACLGEGEYDALIRTRRTKISPASAVGELKLLYGNWGRALNATSTAGVTVPISGSDGGQCCEVLNQITDPWRYELEIYRNGTEVWCGPIRDVSADPSGLTGQILASDLSYWNTVRVFLHTMKPRGVDLAEIYAGYLAYAFQGVLPTWGEGDHPLYHDDPGIIVNPTPVGIPGDRTVAPADLKYLQGELEELSRTGCDWTVTNRTWWVGGLTILKPGTTDPLRLPGTLTDEHFRRPGRVRRTGEGQITEGHVRGNAVRASRGGPDPADGVLIQRVLDEYSIEDQASADAAADTWYARARDPLEYLEGNNALDPSAPITIQTLIPGALKRVDLSGGGCVPIRTRLRLERLEANWNAEGEEITIALQPPGTSFDARGEGG